MALVVDVKANICGDMTLAAVKSTVTAASAVAGHMNSTAAVVSVSELRNSNKPCAIREPVAPSARQRTTPSNLQLVLTKLAIGVITCEDRIAVPLASAPLPHNNEKVCVP